MANIDLRCGDWRDVLDDVDAVDAVISDPPYSDRTHAGHFSGTTDEKTNGDWLARRGYDDKRSRRTPITYQPWGEGDVEEFCLGMGHPMPWLVCCHYGPCARADVRARDAAKQPVHVCPAAVCRVGKVPSPKRRWTRVVDVLGGSGSPKELAIQ